MSEITTVKIGANSYEVPGVVARALRAQLLALFTAKEMQDELVSPNFLMDDAGSGFNTRAELVEDARAFFVEAPVGVYRQPLNGYRWLGETHFIWRKSESGDPVLQGVVVSCPECCKNSSTHCENCGGGGEVVSLDAVPDHFSESNQSGAH